MIFHMDEKDLEAASEDPHFLRHYDSVMARLKGDLEPRSGWFGSTLSDPRTSTLAYFSAEYGIHRALPFYAGGLGLLAGDFLKECSDLGIPAVGMGFMYPQGYLLQNIDSDGWQTDACEFVDWESAPIRKVTDRSGKPLVIELPLAEPIYVNVWKVTMGRTDLYLMDTSVESNLSCNRGITDRLYTGDKEQRLKQEIVLGIGGMRVLRAMGIEPAILHLNEGHPAFAILERIRGYMQEGGMSYSKAFELAKNTTVFTTHTPVPAGHDKFPPSIMEKYFKTYLFSLGMTCDDFFKLGFNPKDPLDGFNLTAFALRMSGYRNCVSKRHQEVSREMWHHLWPELPVDKVPIDYVTNGVHVPTWISRRLGDVIFNQYLGRDWLEEHDKRAIWELVDEIPDEVIWNHHNLMKSMLINNIKERARKKWLEGGDPQTIMALGILLDERALTLGFARRFAPYKRATLLLRDLERLRRMVNNPRRPVQIIFAGKAHPADQNGKMLLNEVFRVARDKSFGGRIAFVEDYDEYLAQYMVHGVDVWLNTPLPPNEACGTSGMKATLNGIPQLSILDGWWCEGYNGKNGWALKGAEGERSDERDAASIYDILERKVVPLFYRVQLEDVHQGMCREWVKMMKEAIKRTGPNFCAKRMVKEYADKFYRDALNYAMKS